MKLIPVVIFCFVLTLNAQINDTTNSIQTLINEGSIEKAREILHKNYEENDEDPHTNYWLSYLALRDTLYDDAIDYLDVAIEADENNAEYYYLLGSSYGLKAQNSGAITAAFAAPKVKSNWIKTLEINPDHLQAKWGLFQFYINAPGIVGGDEEEAKKLADDLAKNDPPRGYNMLGFYYAVVDENMEEADKAITKSMTYDSDEETRRIVINSNTNLLNRLGYRFLNQEDYDNSYKYFKWAIRLRPDFENPYDSMGDYFSAKAQYDSALVYYNKALIIRPNFTVSKYNKGRMLEKLGDRDQAISVYRDLIMNNTESNYADQAMDRVQELEN